MSLKRFIAKATKMLLTRSSPKSRKVARNSPRERRLHSAKAELAQRKRDQATTTHKMASGTNMCSIAIIIINY